jgi:hypothetical protein
LFLHLMLSRYLISEILCAAFKQLNTSLPADICGVLSILLDPLRIVSLHDLSIHHPALNLLEMGLQISC